MIKQIGTDGVTSRSSPGVSGGLEVFITRRGVPPLVTPGGRTSGPGPEVGVGHEVLGLEGRSGPVVVEAPTLTILGVDRVSPTHTDPPLKAPKPPAVPPGVEMKGGSWRRSGPEPLSPTQVGPCGSVGVGDLTDRPLVTPVEVSPLEHARRVPPAPSHGELLGVAEEGPQTLPDGRSPQVGRKVRDHGSIPTHGSATGGKRRQSRRSLCPSSQRSGARARWVSEELRDVSRRRG